MPPPNAMRQKCRILTWRGSANNFVCHFVHRRSPARETSGGEQSGATAVKCGGDGGSALASRLSESERIGMCNYKIQNGDPLCRKGITGPVWRRCANSTFGVLLASPRLTDPGSFRVKSAVVSVHIT